jgi:signal transduction histidine kinase
MGTLYAYSLVPVLAVALLLFFTAALRGKNTRGLASYCLSVAAWCGTLLLACLPETAAVGQRLVATGAFSAAAFLHAAYDVTEQRNYRLVWMAYLVAAAIVLLAALVPGLVYDPLTLREGPLFWPLMALAVVANTVPLVQLYQAYRVSDLTRQPILRRLFIAGLLADIGAMGNAQLLAHGLALPFGMLLVLASLLVLAGVVREHEPVRERRLLDRSLLYSALAAFLSAGFMFGVSAWTGSERFLGQYRLGAFFLLSMAALAFEPLRQQIQESLGIRLVRGSRSTDLLRELEQQADKAAQAGALAEVGALVSAVAHEVRNPLGVMAAHLKVLERSGANPDAVAAMKEQIDRAARFVDDLLRYGRPRPLELRRIDLLALVELAWSTALQGLGAAAPKDVQRTLDAASGAVVVEADQAQLLQVFVVLFENALLALAEGAGPAVVAVRIELAAGERLWVHVEDSGPGIPEAIRGRLFQPFVSGRPRGGPRPGTGLGLATARSIIERHHGAIRAEDRSERGGAHLVVELPLSPVS